MAENLYDHYGNIIGYKETCNTPRGYSPLASSKKHCPTNTMANPKGTVHLADGEMGLYPSFPTNLGQVLKAVPIDVCNPSSRNNIEVDWDTLAINDIYGLTESLAMAGKVKSVSVNNGVKSLPDDSGNINLSVSSTGNKVITAEDIKTALGITNTTSGILNVANGVINFIPNTNFSEKKIKIYPYTTTDGQPGGPHAEYNDEFKAANPTAQIRGLEVALSENDTQTAADWINYNEFVDMMSIVPNQTGKLQVAGTASVSPFTLGNLVNPYNGQQGSQLPLFQLNNSTVPVGTTGTVTINGQPYNGTFDTNGFNPATNSILPLTAPLGNVPFILSTTSLFPNLTISSTINISASNVSTNNPFPYSFGNPTSYLEFKDASVPGSASLSFAIGVRDFSVVVSGSSVPRGTPLGSVVAAPGSVSYASAVNQFYTISFGNGDTISGSIYYSKVKGEPGDPSTNNKARIIMPFNVTSQSTIQYINTAKLNGSAYGSSNSTAQNPTATLRLYTTSLNENANSTYDLILVNSPFLFNLNL